MRISVYYAVAYLAGPLVMWRVHSGTITNQFGVGGKSGTTNEHLRDQLRCKRKIVDLYGKDIPEERHLRQMLRTQITEKVAFQANCMLDEGMAKGEVPRFLYGGMGTEFTHLLGESLYWKMFAKTILPPHTIQTLKNIRHILLR